MLTQSEGDFLLKLARTAIESYVLDGKVIIAPRSPSPILKENMGVFVTLHINGELRGCIGYPEPVKPLLNALIEVAIGAATGDPRFSPLNSHELEKIHVEVSVLTLPELIVTDRPSEYLEKIDVGHDGLIIEKGLFRGLLLPQVPVEWGWDTEEFLANTCLKAGMTPDCWLQEGVKIYSFQSQIFNE
jgi:uncharacterized protein (TIGR00296 family)